MRVEYTIQGMQPPVDPRIVRASNAGGPYGATFGERLRRMSANFGINWRQTLRLDQPPPGPTTLGPPPKPGTIEAREPADLRMQWRRLVDRSRQSLAGDTAGGPASPKVQRMQVLLVQMQSMEDGVLARCLTATRG